MIDFKQKIEQEERYRYPAQEDPRPNRKTKRLFVYLGILGVFILLFAGKVLVSSQNSSGNWLKNTFFSGLSHLIINPSAELKGEKEDRINILLLGYGGENHDGGNLTDTIMLLSLKPSTKQASMISIPRDLLVPNSNGVWRKVNSLNAYAETKEKGSGGQAVLDSLSALLEEPIPYYVKVDFEGFTNVIDEVGGVDVYVENTFDDYTYPIQGREDNPDYYSRFEHLHFDKGWQKMDGATALKYSRSRHSLGSEGNDFARAKRQQIVIEAAKEKVLSRNTLTNPATLTKIIGQLESHISTNIKVTEMIKLWNLFKDVQKAQITNRVLDNSVSGLLMDSRGDDGAYILLPRGGSFRPIREMIDTVFGGLAQNSTNNSDITIPEVKTVKINKIKEAASIEILNGTWLPGLASKASDALKASGFTVLKLGNSQERNYTRNTIYDLSYGEKKESLEALKTAYDAEVSFSWPLWLEEKISAYENKTSTTTIDTSSSTVSTSTVIKKTATSTNPNFILILGDKNNTATANE
ncbi:MAG: LCP family protein [Patescibacteria group bacterium]